jgi:hypothetical protein
VNSRAIRAFSCDLKQSYWRPIGVAWPHGDGDGFFVKLDFLPLNGADIVIRKAKGAAVEEPEETVEAA